MFSPDSRYLAFVAQSRNLNSVVQIYGPVDGGSASLANITDGRSNCDNPAFSGDGGILYCVTDR